MYLTLYAADSPLLCSSWGITTLKRMMPFLSVCLVSDKATGKKEKVLCLQLSSGGLTQVV